MASRVARIGGRRLALAALALALAAAAALWALRFSHAAAWRLPPRDRIWVEKALAAAAAGSVRSRDSLIASTRPRLWHPPGRTCVLLGTHRKYGGGSYRACFDRSTGRLVDQLEVGPCLCAEPLADRLWELVW